MSIDDDLKTLVANGYMLIEQLETFLQSVKKTEGEQKQETALLAYNYSLNSGISINGILKGADVADQKEVPKEYHRLLTIETKAIDLAGHHIVKKVVDIVGSQMSDPLFNSEELARQLQISRSSLHRKIKSVTGFGPSELILTIRLRKAAILILNQSSSISGISLGVGFKDHSYFTKIFKKEFGVVPSKYIQLAKPVDCLPATRPVAVI